MKIMLNKDKYGMLFLDGFAPLTFDEPGPLEVTVKELTSRQVKQLNYNLLRGAIIVDDPNELKKYNEILEPVIIPSATKTIAKNQDISEMMKEQESELVKLLTKTISTIKKSVPALKGSELREILRLEKSGKNRKSLVGFLDEANKANTETVSAVVGKTPIDLEEHSKLVKGGLGLAKYSKNVSDVVDSEVEEVTLKTTDDEE